MNKYKINRKREDTFGNILNCLAFNQPDSGIQLMTNNHSGKP